MFSLARRSMGRRCSKKAVRCGAIGVLVLACTRGGFSPQVLALLRVGISWWFHGVSHPGWVLRCLRPRVSAVSCHGHVRLPIANSSARSAMSRISSGTASRYQYVWATVLWPR